MSFYCIEEWVESPRYFKGKPWKISRHYYGSERTFNYWWKQRTFYIDRMNEKMLPEDGHYWLVGLKDGVEIQRTT